MRVGSPSVHYLDAYPGLDSGAMLSNPLCYGWGGTEDSLGYHGSPFQAAPRFATGLQRNDALFELWHGVAKSSGREFNRKRLEPFFAGPVYLRSFEDGDAKFAGTIRSDLEAVGKPIGAYDVLIAGQAVRNKLTLITANISEFARRKGLDGADWGKP